MGEISNWGNCVARTPMYALAINRRFCPAAPMKKAPTTVLDSLHHCWGPNWHKTTLKQIQWCLMLGTLADDLSCPVPPPSLVLYSYSYCTRFGRAVASNSHIVDKSLFWTTWWNRGCRRKNRAAIEAPVTSRNTLGVCPTRVGRVGRLVPGD